MPATIVPAGFKDIEKAVQVRGAVNVGMLDRVPHARLGGEMNHARKPLLGEQTRQTVTIAEVDLRELESVVVLKQGEARFLQGGIVVGVHVVETDNSTPLLQEPLRDMKADKAGSAGDQHRVVRHRAPSLKWHG